MAKMPVTADARNPFVLGHLHALGAREFVHPNGSLERHLRATARLLRRWGNRDAVCLAGLYHAVYGTAGIRGALVGLDARAATIDVIGVEAEGLVYLYGACDRDGFHPRIGTAMQRLFVDRFARAEYAIDACRLRDFCEITVANELELARRSAAFRARHARALMELVERMQGLISDSAYAAARAALRQ